MTLTEILAEARSRLADTNAPYLWSDAELTGYLNEAINEVAEKKKLFRDSLTAAICRITILAADASADLPLDSRITEIISAKLNSQTLFVTRTTKKDLEAWNPDWRNPALSGTGTPTKFLTDYSEGYLTLYPKSSVNDTLCLTVYRLPLTQMSTGSGAASPEIHFKHHPRLFNGMLGRAYLKDDTQTLDPQKAAGHLALWKLDMEEIGRSRRNLHDAGEFLGPHYGAI